MNVFDISYARFKRYKSTANTHNLSLPWGLIFGHCTLMTSKCNALIIIRKILSMEIFTRIT